MEKLKLILHTMENLKTRINKNEKDQSHKQYIKQKGQLQKMI